MKVKNKHLVLRFIIIFILIISLFACCLNYCVGPLSLHYSPSFEVKLLDEETKQPIEGAILLITYKYDFFHIFPIKSATDVVAMREIKANKEGRIKVPKLIEFRFIPVLLSSFKTDREIFVYHPEYFMEHLRYPKEKHIGENIFLRKIVFFSGLFGESKRYSV